MSTTLEYFGIPPSNLVETENRYRYLGTLGQTTFSATYTVGYVDVIYNGAELDPAIDFTATDGLHIILTLPCVGGETIEIISKRQIQNSDIYSKEEVNSLLSNYYGVAGGTSDAITLNTSPSFTTFIDGMEIKLRTSFANLSATPTISINGLPALPIVRSDETNLSGNDWLANTEITLRYIQVLNKLALMSGSSTVTSPNQFDSSSKIPNTSWVSNLGLKPSKLLTYTSAVSLNSTQAGSMIILTASAPYVVTLPGASTVPSSNGFVITNVSNQTLTLACSGSDVTDSGNIFVLTPGARYCIVSDGISTWREVFFSNQIAPNFVNPTAETPAFTDNSTLLATTAFSQLLGQRYGLQTSSIASATVALSSSSFGSKIALTATGVQTITLPDPSTGIVGSSIELIKETIGASPAIINSFNNAAVIDSGSGLVSTLNLQVGETMTLTWSGSSWIVSGSNLFRRLAFPTTLGAAGSVAFPGGTFRQWGQFSSTTGSSATAGKYSGSTTLTFPIIFPTSLVHFSATIIDSSGTGQQFGWWLSSTSSSNVVLNVECLTASKLISGTWEAVGY